MNDDELIERLRRTLHERAEALRPGPGQLPAGGSVPDWSAMSSTDPAGAGGPAGGHGQNPPRDAGAHGPDPRGVDPLRERQTAEYAVLPPTGPVPIVGRRRRRWPPVAGAATLLAAAAATVTAVALSGRGHPVTVQQGRNTPPTTATPSPTTLPAPVTTLYPPPNPNPGATSSGQPVVPAGFRPASVTFVSPEDGWVLGLAPGTGACDVMARTVDGGYTWSKAPAPPIEGSCAGLGSTGAYPVNVRFADHADGWVWTQLDGVPSRLWSTHDAGATWNQVPVALEGATIGDLEAAGGQVHMVVYGSCPQGSAGCQGQAVERILSSAATSDNWKASPLSPSIGAGPVLSPALTLWGRTGWLVNNNRTAVSGARLTSTTGWAAWTPACSSANGTAQLAAASAQDLVAVCAEGMWGTPDAGMQAGREYLFRSADAGSSWTAQGQLPGQQPLSVTTPAGDPQTVVVADGEQGLEATFDGGANWYTMQPGPASAGTSHGGYVFDYVGFTTATQGVAVASQPEPTLFMTRDGGHTWKPVSF